MGADGWLGGVQVQLMVEELEGKFGGAEEGEGDGEGEGQDPSIRWEEDEKKRKAREKKK